LFIFFFEVLGLIYFVGIFVLFGGNVTESYTLCELAYRHDWLYTYPVYERVSFPFMLAIILSVFNCSLQQLNVELILLTFQVYVWTLISAATEGVSYVFSFIFIGILVVISTIICYLSYEQSLEDGFSDLTETFIFNVLQVEWSLYSPITLEFIVSINKTPESQ
jgi:hypothetical protein